MKKFLWISFSIVIFLFMISFVFFYRIWALENLTKKQMITNVKKHLPMVTQIEQVDYFAGDKVYYVMFAKDRDGDELMIWTNDEELRYRYLDHYLTKEQIKDLVNRLEKNFTIKRITPGIIYQERFIYEVLYEDDEKRLGYIYYDLQTGEFIKKYRLGITIS
ncbi:hypothetical protein [Tepidibacillus sp. LV47]|uniref:hypothetical protein n=1 Tax=Tepidibacillus sp. LV47 TaxID=3398228 RepID=UPI003AAA6ACE